MSPRCRRRCQEILPTHPREGVSQQHTLFGENPSGDRDTHKRKSREAGHVATNHTGFYFQFHYGSGGIVWVCCCFS